MENLTPETKATIGLAPALAVVLLQNLPDATLLIDAGLTIVACNKMAEQKVQEVLHRSLQPGDSILEFAPQGRHNQLQKIFSQILNGTELTTETKFALPGQDERVFENSFLPARDENGVIIGVLLSAKDISQRQRAERNLQAAEERWQFAFEASSQAAWEWNLQTNEVIYSSSYKKMYGFDDDELSSDISEWQSRIHPEDRKLLDEAIEKHTQSGEEVYETTYRIRVKNGDYKWILARGKLVRSGPAGSPLRMIGTHTDLTETLKTKEEIHRINERFHYAAKASSQALWEWNPVTGEAYVSPIFTELFGWQTDEYGSFENWHRYIHPDDAEATVGHYYQTLQNPAETIWQASYRLKKADGSYAQVADKAYIIRNEAGEAIRVIGATEDVTVVKRLEQELLQSELETKKRINQASVDSQEQERNNIGEELHDNINQVLTTTRLYLELALSNKQATTELLQKACKNLGDVITEIRQLSRSLMDPSLGDLGLLDAVRGLAENLNLVQKTAFFLDIDERAEALLDRKQKLAIFRILQEALNNVVRHANASRVNITLKPRNGHLLLEVCDDGAGFALDLVKKGAGLKNITNRVYLVNGSLNVASQPGQGCTLSINIPIYKTN